MGIGIGIAVKVVIHVINGAPILSFFKLNAEIIQEDDTSATIMVRESAIFSTWISLRKHLDRLLREGKTVTLNLAETQLVDHTVMSKLYEWVGEFEERGCDLFIKGLAQHRPMSDSVVAAHVKRKS